MTNFSMFTVMGLEIEYMLVDCHTMAVQAKSDKLLHELAGQVADDVELGNIALSNELVLHVIELKNNGPKSIDTPTAQHFQSTIQQLQPLLQKHQLMLLPTGAHPFMDPQTETKRWPHGHKDIYNQYNQIFNCSGHGWSNLQSMHINLPFANDEEFNQLHNTIRLLIPLLPAIAASTPILDKQPTGFLDSRLIFYAQNQQRIPCISGAVIPEFIQSQSDYQRLILEPMYAAIRPLDPSGLLQHEWLNSRAAIPKFEYMAVEIRIIDSQECVNADIAIAHVTHALLQSWLQYSTQHLERPIDTHRLKSIYDKAIQHGFDVVVDDSMVLEQWQLPKRSMSLRDAWSLLIERVSPSLNPTSQRALEHILRFGNLSQRILTAAKNNYAQDNLERIYRQLGDCLLSNQLFLPS